MMALVTGGASCGKSAFAERLCTLLGGDLVYMAAMRPFGEEGQQRVRKHRAQRAGKGFTTVECFDGFERALREGRLVGATVLLECLSNVVANELFGNEQQQSIRSRQDLSSAIVEDIGELARMSKHLVVVGNDVGCDGVSYPYETRIYQDVIGEASREIAISSDLVVESVAGLPMVLKFERTAGLDEDACKALGIFV